MLPLWKDAVLSLRHADGIVAVVEFDGAPQVASAETAEMGEGPSSWGRLEAQATAATSGRCGSLLWSAGMHDGALRRPVGAGRSWVVVAGGGFWIAAGADAEAPPEWEFPDGRRGPTWFGDL